jgi:hypothetical protein
MLNFSWKSISLASPNLLKIFGFAESSENIWLRRIYLLYLQN